MNFFNRSAVLIISLLLTTTAFPACARVVTDIFNRTVEIPDKPSRVLLGESRLLFTLALVRDGDLSADMIGWPNDMEFYDRQSWQQFLSRWPKLKQVTTLDSRSFTQVNTEKILSLKPDLVILSRYGRNQPGHSALEQQLDQARIPFIYVDVRIDQLKNTVPSLHLLGKVFNSEDKAERFIDFYQSHMVRISERLQKSSTKKPDVMIQLHLGIKEECCVTVVHGSFADLMEYAGGRNIAESTLSGVYAKLNPEKVLVAAPDYYITTGLGAADDKRGIKLGPSVSQRLAQQSFAEMMKDEPLLLNLSAFRQGNALSLWHNFYISPQHVVAVEFFARLFHPQLFADIEPENTLKTIYQKFMGLPFEGTYWGNYPVN